MSSVRSQLWKTGLWSRAAIILLVMVACSWLFIAPHTAEAAPVLVQSKANSVGNVVSTTFSITLDAAVTSGNLVAGVVTYGQGDVNILTSITDDKSNTYTIQRRDVDVGNSQSAASFYLKNITNGPITITANFSADTAFRGMSVHEVSGLQTSSPLDVETGQFQSVPGTGANAVTSGSVTTTANGEYIFGGTITTSALPASAKFTAGTGFTERQEVGTDGVAVNMASEDQIQTTAGSIAATFTQSQNDSDITFIMTFKAAENNPPSAPTNLAVASVSGWTIALSWTAPSSNPGITSYKIYRGTSSLPTTLYATQTSTTTATYTDSFATSTIGMPYYYRVTAVNDNGESGYSNQVNGLGGTARVIRLKGGIRLRGGVRLR